MAASRVHLQEGGLRSSATSPSHTRAYDGHLSPQDSPAALCRRWHQTVCNFLLLMAWEKNIEGTPRSLTPIEWPCKVTP